MFLLFLAILIALAVVGSRFKESSEDWFGAKILAYGFLSAGFIMLRLSTGLLWFPVGFVVAQALLLRNAPNRRAKRYATVVGLVGLLLTASIFGLGPPA